MASTPAVFTRGLAGRQQRVGLMFALPAGLAFAAILGYPIFESFRTSLYSMDLLTGEASFVGLDNVVALSQDQVLLSTLGHTALWTVLSLVGQLGLGLAAALLIDADWPGMRWIRQILLVPYVVPVIASALLWQWMLDGNYGILSASLQSWGLLGEGASPLGQESTSLATVIVVNIWRGFPFAMLVFWARLRSIDRGQYEAAKVDGAGPWQEFVHVTLPNLRSAALSLLALRGIWTLMYFELVWLLTRGGPSGSSEILSTYVYKVVSGEFRVGYAAAIASVVGLVLAGVALAVWIVLRIRARPRHA
jgi:multiple sugar transport system permease protein